MAEKKGARFVDIAHAAFADGREISTDPTEFLESEACVIERLYREGAAVVGCAIFPWHEPGYARLIGSFYQKGWLERE